MFARAYAQQDYAVRYRFYETIRGHPWFTSPACQIFEIHILMWFWHYRYGNSLGCTGSAESSPQLQIRSCPENLKFFYKVEELKDISEPGKPICLIPTSPTFPTLSAVILTSNAVITAQITIALKHDANEQEFDLIYKNLPPGLLAKRPGRYHVFITDTGFTAKSLREQNQMQIPNGTLVYSADIGVEYLDLMAPVTEELVEALDKARVSMSWLYAI